MYTPDTVDASPATRRTGIDESDSPRSGTASVRPRFGPGSGAVAARRSYRYFAGGRVSVPSVSRRVGLSDRRSNPPFNRIEPRVPQWRGCS